MLLLYRTCYILLFFSIFIPNVECRLTETQQNAFDAQDALIRMINVPGRSWTAAHNKFSTMTPDERSHYHMSHEVHAKRAQLIPKMPISNVYGDIHRTRLYLPLSYDFRSTNCKSPIRDQMSCGGCWAFSSTSAADDRHCKKFGNLLNLTPQEMISCEPVSFGCAGGYTYDAAYYLMSTGAVDISCWAFQKLQQVTSTIACPSTMSTRCPSSGAVPLYHKTATMRFFSGSSEDMIASVMWTILHHGPLVATFEVFEDFYSYRSGVYVHVRGQSTGWHAVEVIGWGEESGNYPYWCMYSLVRISDYILTIFISGCEFVGRLLGRFWLFQDLSRIRRGFV